MEGNTTLILINIFIIGIIAIIIVKLYYRKHEEADEDIDLSFTKNALKGMLNRSEKENAYDQTPYSQTQMNNPYSPNEKDLYSSQRQGVVTAQKEDGIYAVNKVNINNNISRPKFEKQQINYRSSDNMSQDEKVKFGSDINVNKTEKKDVADKLAKRDSYTELVDSDQSTKKEIYAEIKSEDETKDTAPDHELKDLFTIDELIKESKRKDSKRAKKTPVKTEEKSEEKTEVKEEPPKEKETTIADIINDSEDKIAEKSDVLTSENYSEPTLKSPTKVEKSIDDVIKESVEEKIDEMSNDVDQSTKKETYREIYQSEEPIARAQDSIEDQPLRNDLFEQASEVKYSDDDNMSVMTPNEDDFGSSFDEGNIFGISEDEEEDDMDLDYRKDIAKITNKFKNSKIFNAAKNKISPNEDEYVDDPSMNEEFIRNVRSYDQNDYDDVATIEPIHNTAYEEVVNQKTREENTERLNKSREIKEPPVKDNITFTLNNNEVVLHKNDEIIFNYNGDSYSSKVYKIVGKDITVKFRGQYITIQTSDIKKIF